ncbi:MAG TPA: PQQ-dependent sugar dehydrogenase [Vicinamibacterales bacterium]
MPRLFTAAVLVSLAVVPPAVAQIRSELVVSGLSLPLAFVQDPSQPTVQLVAEQGGRIRVIQSGTLLTTDFLDLTNFVLSAGEQGLLGIAFAPDYASSGRFYVNFINKAGHTVIARFLRMASDHLRADPATRFDLVWPNLAVDGVTIQDFPFITQSFANHNGGNIVFGPDGFLYIGMGDGGGGNDPLHFAQNPNTLLGKMLRVDVSVPLSNTKGYVIPPSNPFVNQPGVLGEIWAFGYRNPWRWSFDDPSRGGTGAMVVGDVGQSSFEEIDYEPAGAGGRNYGWRNREGMHDNVTTQPLFPGTPVIDPIHEYPRSVGTVVTGGYVYRGSALGGTYVGRYFFADVGSSHVFSLGLSINPITHEATVMDILDHTLDLGAGAQVITSFGVDADGELYTVNYGAGEVYRISPGAPLPGPTDGSCVTPMPGPTWTCFGGNWYPPGFPIPGTAPTPAPSPTTPPPPSECTTPQPAADWVCVNGDWLPPGFPGTTTPPPPPSSGPPPPPPPPPPPSTGCTTPAPDSSWTCVNGDWLPPGFPGTSTPSSPPTTPPPPTSCPGSDPFLGLPGLAGVCINGDWIPTELIQTMATVQFNAASGGFWELRLDYGRVFVPMGGLSPAFQTAGQRVTITGKLRIDLASVPGPIIELLSIQ